MRVSSPCFLTRRSFLQAAATSTTALVGGAYLVERDPSAAGASSGSARDSGAAPPVAAPAASPTTASQQSQPVAPPPVDVHAHFIPPGWVETLRRDGSPYNARVEEDASGQLWLRLGDQPPLELLPDLLDSVDRAAALRQSGLGYQVLSPPMPIVAYQLDAPHGQALSRLFNEANADFARRAGGSFVPVATVPMQSSAAAVEELDHAVRRLGIRMVEIGTNVNGANLDEEAFAPFFARAAELGTLVQLHPHQVAGGNRLRRYNLGNLVGNPFDTTIAAASLVFGGVLDRYPSLQICLVHGGGALSYLVGRMSHGYAATDQARTMARPPREYLSRFYYDTLVHDADALRYLHDLVGAERLMLGTDYPYDMGNRDPLGQLARAGLASDPRIIGETAARLLGIR